ncbi:hypothetical protein SAMN05216359_105202 [Roseateles sp. YR242]|uniref:hypothetical protein n=1 Tax=Roseateles sp. YR242 TaxID=1855305 RepID=UPI0008ABFA7A|nr:hypothetical protein [Roseateles sp. YR242]SEL10628.1 hypothetical protein SAMN05216359_105202 [Roseateles sp. YR242]
MVIKQIKQWFTVRANAARWRPLIDWAEERGGLLRHARDGRGFVIDLPRTLPGLTRIEWGPSQRSYISGYELRMRCELKLSPDMQMMVIERKLMEQLESSVFEAYTDTLRTRVDTDTPEEMRWLVMFPKQPVLESKLVKQRFGVVGVNQELCTAWMSSSLCERLAQASQDILVEGRPFVLLSLRGNVYLRTAMPDPSLPEVQGLTRVLEAAALSAQEVGHRFGEGGSWPTTTSVAWHNRPAETDHSVPRNDVA